MKNNYSSINNLKKIREKKRLTLQEVANRTGLTLHEIHFLENDKLDLKKAKFDTIQKLCDGLQASVYDLFIDKEYAKTLLSFTKKRYCKAIK